MEYCKADICGFAMEANLLDSISVSFPFISRTFNNRVNNPDLKSSMRSIDSIRVLFISNQSPSLIRKVTGSQLGAFTKSSFQTSLPEMGVLRRL